MKNGCRKGEESMKVRKESGRIVGAKHEAEFKEERNE